MSHNEKIPDVLPPKPVLFSEESVGGFSIGVIELNRPQVLNALNTECYEKLEPRLLEWMKNEKVAAVIIHSHSEKAFSAGGDVKNLVLQIREQGLDVAKDFFTREYFVDELIHRYPKPVIVFADGITMGAGVGLMNGASHRIVTERSVLSMPEQGIGLFPDVGATGFLSDLPSGFGLFMGLCAARISAADAVRVGLADFYMDSKMKRKVYADLLRLPWVGDNEKDREMVTHYLARALSAPPDAQCFEAYQNEVGDLFAGAQRTILQNDSPEKMRETYLDLSEKFTAVLPQSDFVADAKKRFLSGSPTSKQVFFEALHRHRGYDMREVFIAEWEMAIRFSKEAEFFEGVRATLIDKDFAPKWNPSSDADVRDIGRFFSSGEKNNLAERMKQN